MVFFNHYLFPTRLLSFACQEALSVFITTRGAKCLRALCSYQEVSLCLVSQVTLRSSTFASSIDNLAKSHAFYHITHLPKCYETSIFISFLNYWQVTLIWSPYGDASLIRSLLIGDTSTTYYTDVAIRVTMTLY